MYSSMDCGNSGVVWASVRSSILRRCGAAFLFLALPVAACVAQDVSLLDVDYPALVSQADLVYQSPAGQPVEGLPIGNGRMGTLVWTTPSAICMQINRSDVFAVNKTHAGPQYGPCDYCGACAQVSIDVGSQAFASGEAFLQRLAVHDAEMTIHGEGVRVRCFVSAVGDVLALEIDDQRAEPQAIRATVSMWRASEVIEGNHAARWGFIDSPGAALVVQRFQEADYHCASAVAARIVADDVQIQQSSERSQTIVAPARMGKRTILLSSAASLTANADVGKAAVESIDNANRLVYDELRNEHTRWWHEFWSRSFVSAASEDGLAAFMQRLRCLHLYYMASTSRGPVPAKWNGSIFSTAGDARRWGSEYWVWTTEMPYMPLPAADAVDLTDPFFDMYIRQLPDCEKAARQRWNANGAFFPETAGFDGPVVLPDDVALEFRKVLLGESRPADLSDRARALCQFEGHLYETTFDAPGSNPNDLAIRQRNRPYTWISHIVSSGSELAVQAWWRYRYTGDKAWLRTHAYPLLRGAAEFYRSMVKKGQDGRYHLAGTNVHEDFWGVDDSIMDLAAIRGAVPPAIRAAEILGIDADLRAEWQKLLDNLAPYPMGSDPRSKAITGAALADDVWSAGYLGGVAGRFNSEDVWLNPVFPFENWTLETRSPSDDWIVQKLLDLAPRHLSVMNENAALPTAIRTPIAAARAGRGHELPAILAGYYASFRPLPNGLSMLEGENAQSIEHLGLLTTALQEGLLQSVSARPGGPEIISVFPAWPKQWEASFRLLARGGFLVTAAMRQGGVEFVEIESRLGESCRVRNPWGSPCRVIEIGGNAKTLDGDLLCFDTERGHRYRIVPKDTEVPGPRRIAPEPVDAPTSYSLKLPSGNVVTGMLGRGAK